MRSTISVNPFRVRLWKLHDRLEEHISEETCRAEIDSFTKHGQLVPVLGRRLKNDPDFDVELIFGARRLFVARHINTPIFVELCDMSDQAAIVAMDVENRQRKDISPYERGLSYTRWLRSGYFKSQEEISHSLNVSQSHVSRLMKLARLPAAVVNAFSSATDICEEWGIQLVSCIDDPVGRNVVLRKARELSRIHPRPAATDVYKQLLAASVAGRKPRASARDQIVVGRDGTPLFRIRQARDSYALLIPARKLTASKLNEIQAATAAILDSAGEVVPASR